MLANFLEHIARNPESADYDLAFVKEVKVHTRSPREPRVERTIYISWVLIALKCWLVVWLVHRFSVPIDSLWINAPTVIFGLVGTAVYIWRD